MSDGDRRWRRLALHVTRVFLFVAIIALIHIQHAQLRPRQQTRAFTTLDISRLEKFFPQAATLAADDHSQGRRDVLDAQGEPLGYILQTAPGSDHLIGFSGPTNTLIALGPDDRIVGIDVLSSGDTRDHVAQVREDDAFMRSFNGVTREQVAARTDIDAVSGATLTSLAIQESIIHRLSGTRSSLRFPDPLTVDDALTLFASAHTVEQDEVLLSLWYVKDARGEELGSILRTSPFADNIIGYQGPTETRICFDVGGQIIGISIGKSYDNEPYVTYVREDEHFRTLFNGLSLEELADFDLQADGVEGVSGATMTSMAIADGLVVAAEQQRRAVEAAQESARHTLKWSLRDLGTAVVICTGLIIAFTSLRGKRPVRLGFHVVVIGYLGLVNGDMLSQAMIVGWAKNGVPLATASGLVLLTSAAVTVPITTRRNTYCTHLCPHGAAQHLLKSRLPWRLQLPRRVILSLKMIPGLLLAWCILVAMAMPAFALVDIEPFDAWVLGVAGWATISIAVIGLVTSLFVPMAYCRYGCPTGAMLSFLRYNSRSDRWSRRDWFALMLVAFAAALWVAS